MRKTHPLLPLLLIIALALSITMCRKTKPTEEKPKEPEIDIETVLGNCFTEVAGQYNCPSETACNTCLNKDNCSECVAKGGTFCVGPWPYFPSYSCPSKAACDNCYDNGDCSACTQVFESTEGEKGTYFCPSWATSDKCYDDNGCSACIDVYWGGILCGYQPVYICPYVGENPCSNCINNDECSACTSTGEFLCVSYVDDQWYICPSAATCTACEDDNSCSGCSILEYQCNDSSGKEHNCPDEAACHNCRNNDDCSACIPPERYCEGPEEDSEYLCPSAAACATCASQGQCSTCTRIE